MVVLNLAYPHNSEIEFEISQFPDGQQTVTIKSFEFGSDNVLIKSRLNSFKDLELIICATQALREMGIKNISLYIPYCIGGRSDRKFREGGVNYIKSVIAPIINSQGFNSVTILDPHSDILEACINNFCKISNLDLVAFALKFIDNKDGAQDRICLVSPDAGAYKKIYDVAKHFKIRNIITATKVRDLVTGNILRTEIPVLDQHNDLTYVIVDDICDGGRTFVELAKVIKDGRPTAKIYLIVTHGIFSAGFDGLAEYFEGIFTTNSIRDIQVGTIINTFSKNKTIRDFVKQLNVF